MSSQVCYRYVEFQVIILHGEHGGLFFLLGEPKDTYRNCNKDHLRVFPSNYRRNMLNNLRRR